MLIMVLATKQIIEEDIKLNMKKRPVYFLINKLDFKRYKLKSEACLHQEPLTPFHKCASE